MNTVILERNGERIMECMPGEPLFSSPDDVADVIGHCAGEHVSRLLFYPENLTMRFFELGSGEAGAILQKFRNYHVRVALVVPSERDTGKRFREMAIEENRGVWFHVCDDREKALEWLAGG